MKILIRIATMLFVAGMALLLTALWTAIEIKYK